MQVGHRLRFPMCRLPRHSLLGVHSAVAAALAANHRSCRGSSLEAAPAAFLLLDLVLQVHGAPPLGQLLAPVSVALARELVILVLVPVQALAPAQHRLVRPSPSRRRAH